jgi:hypothetical protein
MHDLLRQPVALLLIAWVLFVCWAPLVPSLRAGSTTELIQPFQTLTTGHGDCRMME